MSEWHEETTADGRKIWRCDLGQGEGVLVAAIAKNAQGEWVWSVRYSGKETSLKKSKAQVELIARRLAGLPPRWAR